MRAHKNNSRFILNAVFFSSLLFVALPFFVSAESPASFVIVSPLQTIAIGVASEQITLQSRDVAGQEFKVPSTACASLSSNSAGGEFSSNITSWSAVSVLTIAKNSANRNFYYKDTVSGTHTISIKTVLKPETENRSCANWPIAEWPSGWTVSQAISVGGSGSEAVGTTIPSTQNQNLSATTTDNSVTDSNSSAENTTAVSNDNASSWPAEPQIISRIVGPSMVIAGADIVLKGEALGLDKKLLEKPRYLWNFGDGAIKEGETVMHGYNFSGDYVVILDASSGKFSGTSRLKIKVIPADIVIGEVVRGLDGKIELINNSSQELDLSWWRIKNGSQFFTIPKNTKIMPHGRLPLAAAVMGVAVDDSDVSLLYPNGSMAYKFEKTVMEAKTLSLAFVPEDKAPASVTSATVLPSNPSITEETPKISALSKMTAQTASVALAADVSTEAPAVNPANAPAQKHSSLWLYGLGAVIILGLGFSLMPRPKLPMPAPKNPADEYEIIE